MGASHRTARECPCRTEVIARAPCPMPDPMPDSSLINQRGVGHGSFCRGECVAASGHGVWVGRRVCSSLCSDPTGSALQSVSASLPVAAESASLFFLIGICHPGTARLPDPDTAPNSGTDSQPGTDIGSGTAHPIGAGLGGSARFARLAYYR